MADKKSVTFIITRQNDMNSEPYQESLKFHIVQI